MQFIKLIFLAAALELMCCFGVIEKKPAVKKAASVTIEKVEPIIEGEQMKERSSYSGTPIQIIFK